MTPLFDRRLALNEHYEAPSGRRTPKGDDMIPAQFDYQRAKTLDEALNLLAQNEDAKILAGGHSLIPALKLRLMQPPLLIDIARIQELSYIREENGEIRIGAATTHYQIESSDLLKNICPLLPDCASHIGDVQVRNKGTIGGSVAHADPAGDWPAAMLALDAEMIVVSKNGERGIKADDFFVDLLTTALEAGEILREIRIPKPSGTAQAYVKMPHPASGFAVVGVAANLSMNGNGECQSASIGITGVSSKAYRPSRVEAALAGAILNDETIASASAHAADEIDCNGDLFTSADYRRHLATVYTRRAIEAAMKSVPSA
ncbi:MAG TPA: xanthine dehydrogenase family protein subunit M [Pyrinomonadaceae bacterium]|nr:xanthine dehydrogenase family protein subunit M [Pyrinomonadaceae bacterium]